MRIRHVISITCRSLDPFLLARPGRLAHSCAILYAAVVGSSPSARHTMSAAISRKRSRLTLDADEELQQRREPSPALSTLSDTLKRTRTQCELDELSIVSPEEAWTVDVDAIIASPRLAAPVDSTLEHHDNWARYQKGESLIVLCVQGNLQIHYELLW